MATLDVQPKKKSSWPWVILILILIAAAVIYFMTQNDNGAVNSTDSQDTTSVQRDTITPPVP